MMPRPILVSNFGLTYRKIPVMAIGKEVKPVHYGPSFANHIQGLH